MRAQFGLLLLGALWFGKACEDDPDLDLCDLSCPNGDVLDLCDLPSWIEDPADPDESEDATPDDDSVDPDDLDSRDEPDDSATAQAFIVAVENPSDFDESAFVNALASEMGVEASQVTVVSTMYKVGFSLQVPSSVSQADLKAALAQVHNVAESAVSFDQWTTARRLQTETNIVIATESATDASAIKTAAFNVGPLVEQLGDSVSLDDVELQFQPILSVEVQTSTIGAASTPSAIDLELALSTALNLEVTSDEVTPNVDDGSTEDPADLPAESSTPQPSTAGNPGQSGTGNNDDVVDSALRTRTSVLSMFVLASVMRGGGLASLLLPLIEVVAGDGHGHEGTCGEMKALYQMQSCCGAPDQEVPYVVLPRPTKQMFGDGDTEANPCKDKKPYDAFEAEDGYFHNIECYSEANILQVLEQAGANVTDGFEGQLDAGERIPIVTPYWNSGLCPVNVHWHLGTEHLSVGQYDEMGTGPGGHRRLEGDARPGFQCHHYDAADPKFTTEYPWRFCENMHVGETYEVHWPHSAAGKCGSPWQYQSPFYDGVFCTDGIISLDPLNSYEKIGVQAQVFTIVNDEDYYYPDLFRGMITEVQHFGADIAYYTGSTTGTSRDNTICSRYTPITWQVDRTCHLISASSFDKMCADMKSQQDDMSMDLEPHGARELVLANYSANNLVGTADLEP